MTDIELDALKALVIHQAAWIKAEVAKYGEPQWDPHTVEISLLTEELKRRGSYGNLKESR